MVNLHPKHGQHYSQDFLNEPSHILKIADMLRYMCGGEMPSEDPENDILPKKKYEFLTGMQEVAAFLNISPGMAARLVREGKIKAFRYNKSYMFKKEDVRNAFKFNHSGPRISAN